ncbi:uncharacterized protein LY79DRAFT_578985 [Colletotrichum navitas]|uniref:DUF5672 domain-containing protein n=1 Tax=Colletotrichum navitas TaxID=681940 RepID=A0AAD8Q0S2_9PEZI|nr:uncharacterized protein LY79DRAFT_578985 [Colletotrichum navitas]KAK1593752.1 hypothetical protein LY79DRAFT_578985 [Colletotrichum navitas]
MFEVCLQSARVQDLHMHLLIILSCEHSEHLTYDNQEPSVGDGLYASDALGAHAAPDTSNVAVVIIETDITRVFNLVPVILHFATVLGPTWSIVLMTLESNWDPLNFPASKRLIETDRLRDLIGASIAPQLGQGYSGGLSLRNPKFMYDIITDPDATLGLADFEDQWLNARVRERNGNLPSPEEAMEFSVESMYYERPLGYYQPARRQKDDLTKIAERCPEIGLL